MERTIKEKQIYNSIPTEAERLFTRPFPVIVYKPFEESELLKKLKKLFDGPPA